MDKMQRQYFLRQQMKAIQKELGEGNELQEEIKGYQDKLKKLKVSEEVREELDKQISRLAQMHPESAETTVVRNYLDWMFALPWNKSTVDNLDLRKAKKILDEDHYGLEKVKERILEYLAVRVAVEEDQGPDPVFRRASGRGQDLPRPVDRPGPGPGIHPHLPGRRPRRGRDPGPPPDLCRRPAGPHHPGPAAGRIEQSRLHDGRGGQDRGRFPGRSVFGPPRSPRSRSRTTRFRDHYLGVPFDLSKVMFITTANLLDPIQPAFRDRMEIIQLPGYTEEEKLQIALQHLVPKQIKENALSAKLIDVRPAARSRRSSAVYTREAGVRNLEREIASVCRKTARQVAEGKRKLHRITSQERRELPRPAARSSRTRSRRRTRSAWPRASPGRQSGGEILFVEATKMDGEGRTAADRIAGRRHEGIRPRRPELRPGPRQGALGIDPRIFSQNDFHIHIPEGAIPKDGPSAGITMATALISVCTDTKVRWDVAMTGEITLRGNVLPIGGVKEKVLAAQRAGRHAA